MKVLLINGSPRKNGNTNRALTEIASTLATEGIDSEIFWIGNTPVRGCTACGACRSRNPGKCVFDDDAANRIIEKLATSDGIVIGSPTYYGQPAGQLLAVWQRVCFAGGQYIVNKPAASVAVCRRGGSTAAFQCLNMPFEMLNSLIIGSQYWNVVFGRAEGECEKDTEGMQTMRTMAHNMAWVLKNLNREGAIPRAKPEEDIQWMHFIR